MYARGVAVLCVPCLSARLAVIDAKKRVREQKRAAAEAAALESLRATAEADAKAAAMAAAAARAKKEADKLAAENAVAQAAFWRKTKKALTKAAADDVNATKAAVKAGGGRGKSTVDSRQSKFDSRQWRRTHPQ